MALIIGVPTTVAGVAYTIADDTEFYNFAGDTVISTGANAVVVTGSTNTLNISGHIYGADNGMLIGDATTDINNTVNILAGGVVGTTADDGIEINASHTTINNAGTIVGRDDGIFIANSAGPGATIVNNSGLILANSVAVNNSGSEDVTLTNTGTIRSIGNKSFFGDSGVDTVINSGLMIGEIDLFTGNDVYDGRKGRVTANASGAAVNGDSGDDTLTGGKFVDTFNGDANNDTLTGGLAVDILAGGTGADKFVFNSVAERGDIISDFAVVDDTIQVKGSAFGGLAKGTLSAAAFFANTSGQAHDASDRFIYETDTDKLWYDSNGNAAGGRVLLADLNDVAFTRLDIQVI